MKIKDLTHVQRSHLMFLIDSKTGAGLGWARAATDPTKDCKDWEVFQLFKYLSVSDRSAKLLAKNAEEWNDRSTLDNPKGLCVFDLINEYRGIIKNLKTKNRILSKKLRELR